VTYCPFYQQCAYIVCHRILTADVEQRMLQGEQIAIFVAPPVCHSHWVDRQDLPDE
jgi:hypothetical protein